MSGFSYDFIHKILGAKEYTWCITGAAGFIGSHLVEALLKSNQQVRGFDNFSNGKKENLNAVRLIVGESLWKKFSFVEGDIRNPDSINVVLEGVDFCLHQAALGSVPRSMTDPVLYHENNVTGTVNVFEAAKKAKVKKVVYASSSSVYGDNTEQPKVEERIGQALSPYALTKQINEFSADLYSRSFGLSIVGLRYFNVFGPRQDSNGDYAAVIPRWIGSLKNGERCKIFGDGSTSRDFCPVPNVVLANILAASTLIHGHPVFNVGLGRSTSLNDLYLMIRDEVASQLGPSSKNKFEALVPEYSNFRVGDILHSCASIDKITRSLDFKDVISVKDAIKETIQSYLIKKS